MMRKKSLVYLLFCGMLLNFAHARAADKFRLQIDKKLEVGKHELMFASIASVCEDPDGNFYVLDRMEHKVLKFSPEGVKIGEFGQKGQGPGDFQNPYFLTFTPEGRIAVADEMYNITFLTSDGHFIERIHLDSLLAVGFIGEDRFYGWIWEQDHQTQVMVDSENNVLEKFFQVPISAFSVSAPDESGRQVMFNYSREEFAPSLQFAHFRRYSAVGIGDKYDILILDEKGENKSKIQRELQSESFSKREKNFFERDIEEKVKERGWPRSVLRGLVKKIPDKKIFFSQILLTEELVLVFRIKSDITDESSPVPVDVFSIEGEFLGSTRTPDVPLYMSQDYVYVVRSDEEDNLFLEKAAYKVIENRMHD